MKIVGVTLLNWPVSEQRLLSWRALQMIVLIADVIRLVSYFGGKLFVRSSCITLVSELVQAFDVPARNR